MFRGHHELETGRCHYSCPQTIHHYGSTPPVSLLNQLIYSSKLRCACKSTASLLEYSYAQLVEFLGAKLFLVNAFITMGGPLQIVVVFTQKQIG